MIEEKEENTPEETSESSPNSAEFHNFQESVTSEILCVKCGRVIEEKDNTPKPYTQIIFNGLTYHKICLEEELKNSTTQIKDEEIEIKISLKASAKEILGVIRAIENGAKQDVSKITAAQNIQTLIFKQETEDLRSKLSEVSGILNDPEVQMTPQKRIDLKKEELELQNELRRVEYEFAIEKSKTSSLYDSTMAFERKLINVLAEYKAFYVRCANHIHGGEKCKKITRKCDARIGEAAKILLDKELTILSLTDPEKLRRIKGIGGSSTVREIPMFCCEECETEWIARKKANMKASLLSALQKIEEDKKEKTAKIQEERESKERARLAEIEFRKGAEDRKKHEEQEKLANEEKGKITEAERLKLLEERRKKKTEVYREFCTCEDSHGVKCGKEVDVNARPRIRNMCAEHIQNLLITPKTKETKCTECGGIGSFRDEENPLKSEVCGKCKGKGFIRG